MSRDTIDYKKEKYVVPRYAAFVSPWSMLNGNQVDVALEDLVECGISNFQAKCLLHDAQQFTDTQNLFGKGKKFDEKKILSY